VQCPLALFPAKGDVPDAEEILEELKKKPFGEHCSLKRYDDQIHGVLQFFCPPRCASLLSGISSILLLTFLSTQASSLPAANGTSLR
jgi:hypothetical protein